MLIDFFGVGWYDAVIVTARPDVAAEILPPLHPATPMLSQGSVTERYNWIIMDHPDIDAVWPESFDDAGTLILQDSAENLGLADLGELPPCQVSADNELRFDFGRAVSTPSTEDLMVLRVP